MKNIISVANNRLYPSDKDHLVQKKKAAIMTLGCKVNKYESEAIEELLAAANYQIVDFSSYADVYIINTCTVTAMSDKKSRQMIRRTRKNNPNAIVAVMGCYSQKNPIEILGFDEVNLVFGTSNRAELIKEIEKANAFDKRVFVDDIMNIRDFEEMQISQVSDRTRALVKIQDGCDRFCSYCIIPYTRGRVRSRALDSIMTEVRRLAENQYKEVVLTGIHVASYGKDIGGSLSDVILEIAEIEKIDRIRISSVEPTIISKDFLEKVSRTEKFCEHFHLSMQSGSDSVLKRMNRRYRASEYKDAVELIRNYYPNAAITTDVIVGFPGETETEFNETKRLLEEIKLYETHVFKYSPREGTKAALMPDEVSPAQKAHRSDVLIDLSESNKAAYHSALIGERLEVLFESKDENFWYGHTKNYIKVAVPLGSSEPVNSIRTVVVLKAEKDFVFGELD